MMLDDIGSKLAALGHGTVKTSSNTTPGASGWWIYLGATETSNQSNAIFLSEFAGGSPIDVMGSGSGVAEIEVIGLQVLCRSDSYETARSKSSALWLALHNFTGTIGSKRYLRVECKSSPFPIGRDQSSRWMIGFNCTVYKEV